MSSGASHTGASSPRFLCRSEIFIPARKFIPVSCKRGMTVRFAPQQTRLYVNTVQLIISPQNESRAVIIYNIAGRATQSNSVYVSVIQISTVLTDGVSKSLCQKCFFSHEQPLSALGKILYFARLMDTETRPTSLKTNTIFRL